MDPRYVAACADVVPTTMLEAAGELKRAAERRVVEGADAGVGLALYLPLMAVGIVCDAVGAGRQMILSGCEQVREKAHRARGSATALLPRRPRPALTLARCCSSSRRLATRRRRSRKATPRRGARARRPSRTSSCRRCRRRCTC